MYLARVPVVCLTGHYEPVQVGSQLGVTCLKKPLHFPDVLDAVEAQCGLVGHPRVSETLREGPTRPDGQPDCSLQDRPGAVCLGDGACLGSGMVKCGEDGPALFRRKYRVVFFIPPHLEAETLHEAAGMV